MKPAKPPKHFEVKLHVRTGKGGGDWKHANVNGVDYEYHYHGGSKGNGNHEAIVGDGENILDIDLHDEEERRFVIDSGSFKPEVPSQFRFDVVDDLRAEVHDANTEKAETEYTVFVLDGKNKNLVPCHPMMKNVPRP